MRTCCMAQETLLGALWWRKSEGNPKKEGIYVYVRLIHFAVQQKLTQQCRATILQFLKIYTVNKRKGHAIDWEKIFTMHISDKGLTQTYQQLLQLTNKKNNLIKNGQKIWMDTSQKTFFMILFIWNSRMSKHRSMVSWYQRREDWLQRVRRELLGDGNVLYLDYGGGYTVYCQNS